MPTPEFRTYASGMHRFFDDLVVYLGAVSSLSLGAGAQRSGHVNPFAPTENIILHGRPNVSNIQLVFYPYQVLHPILEGGWPDKVDIEEHPLSRDIPARFSKISGLKLFQKIQIQIAFIHFYEEVSSTVESKFGKNVQNWPTVWNFGRVVRNACAHGGRINFENPRAVTVTWSTLKYSPADNGREIVFQDMTSVELIMLMKEMDVAV